MREGKFGNDSSKGKYINFNDVTDTIFYCYYMQHNNTSLYNLT